MAKLLISDHDDSAFTELILGYRSGENYIHLDTAYLIIPRVLHSNRLAIEHYRFEIRVTDPYEIDDETYVEAVIYYDNFEVDPRKSTLVASVPFKVDRSFFENSSLFISGYHNIKERHFATAPRGIPNYQTGKIQIDD